MDITMLQEELKRWGELIITTGASTFEIHAGDNAEFDTQKNMIRLTTPDAEYIIDGNSIGFVKNIWVI